MTKQDKEEMKEILHDYMAGIIAKNDAKFEIIDMKLDNIVAQTTRTNGRVTKLEEHPQTCAMKDKVRMIEDKLLEQKSVNSWLIKSVGVSTGIIAILGFILKLVGVL
jgi:hypothetical protein